MVRPAALAVLLALTGCGSSEPGPGGVTANEAAALDDAAEMVEGQRLPDDALKPAGTPTGAEATPESSSPAK